jgi:hypothetical protein
MGTLFWQCCVVDDQHRFITTNKPIRLGKQFRFQWCRIPDGLRDEVMQPIVCATSQPLRHWLNAFAIPRSDQPGNVERAHTPPRLVTQTSQERRKPVLKLIGPVQSLRCHNRPLESRPLRNQ